MYNQVLTLHTTQFCFRLDVWSLKSPVRFWTPKRSRGATSALPHVPKNPSGGHRFSDPIACRVLRWSARPAPRSVALQLSRRLSPLWWWLKLQMRKRGRDGFFLSCLRRKCQPSIGKTRGVDVMITIFGDFRWKKTMLRSKFGKKLNSSILCRKRSNFFASFFGRKYFKNHDIGPWDNQPGMAHQGSKSKQKSKRG
jgi:hypothetical protein